MIAARQKSGASGVVLRSGAAVLLLAWLTFGAAAEAEAATYRSYVTGVRTSVSAAGATVGGFLGDVERTRCVTRSLVGASPSLDRVYVHDTCGDGNPAAAWLIWQRNGNAYHYYCVNRLGLSYTVVCQFDWPEGQPIAIAPGLLNVPTPSSQWQWARFSHFSG